MGFLGKMKAFVLKRQNVSDEKYVGTKSVSSQTCLSQTSSDDYWSQAEKMRCQLLAEIHYELNNNRKAEKPPTPSTVIFPAPLLPIPFPPPFHLSPPPLFFSFPPVKSPPPRIPLPFAPLPTMPKDNDFDDLSFLCYAYGNKT